MSQGRSPAGRAPDATRRRLSITLAALSLLLLGATGGFALAEADNPRDRPALDSVDVGFLQDMSVHHEQAVDMATRVRAASDDATLRQLAFDIETGQIAQIGRMQGWLELWQAPAQPVGRAYMSWMEGSGHHPDGPTTAGSPVMPGMASTDEIRQLRATTGSRLDMQFLQLMKRHHEGALPMLRYAAQHASRPEVRNLAAQMLGSQSAEVDLLRRLLEERA